MSIVKLKKWNTICLLIALAFSIVNVVLPSFSYSEIGNASLIRIIETTPMTIVIIALVARIYFKGEIKKRQAEAEEASRQNRKGL